MIAMGILFISIGFVLIYNTISRNRFCRSVKKGNLEGYKETIGTVICNGYTYEDSSEPGEVRRKLISPIVEYEVDGNKYEGRNRTLSTRGEVPEDTKVRVWYKEDDPSNSILETELRYKFNWLLGILCIMAGVAFFVMFNSLKDNESYFYHVDFKELINNIKSSR